MKLVATIFLEKQMQVYLNKSSSDDDWEIKINFNDSEEDVDIIAVLDVISMASTNPSIYEKACKIIGDKYGEGVLTGLMGKASTEEEYEEDSVIDLEYIQTSDTKINKEEAMFILAEIPLVGNINLQP